MNRSIGGIDQVNQKIESDVLVSQRACHACSVSIIVAGRNSAPWISDAIASALSQTVPCEVVFADDCSTDDTVEIARMFQEHGLTIVSPPAHVGVCEVRNLGARETTGEYLCFLDADDVMPPDYIARHLEAMQPGCPFVYGAAKEFRNERDEGKLWHAVPFEQWDRWVFNTVNTSALYARWAFDAAGGWIDAPTMWDHDLALRALRLGSVAPRVSTAVLRYRQHAGSWSSTLQEKTEEMIEVRELIRRRNARLSIASIFSGRLPELFIEWIERVAQSVRFADLPSRPDLNIAYDPRARLHVPAARAATEVWQNSFSKIQLVPLEAMPNWTGEDERRNTVATWLAACSDKLRGLAQGDLVWFIEDDILLPRTACRDLWITATSGLHPPEIVSAVYRSRHRPEILISGKIRDSGGQSTCQEEVELPTGREPVEMDFVGMGCSIVWLNRPALPKCWPSHVCGRIPAHDWAISIETKAKGGKVLWHPGVKCGHARTADEIVWP